MGWMIVLVTLMQTPEPKPIVMPETVIIVKRPDCSFSARPVLQGPSTSTVRGFCS